MFFFIVLTLGLALANWAMSNRLLDSEVLLAPILYIYPSKCPQLVVEKFESCK